jgi:hypothetical protein
MNGPLSRPVFRFTVANAAGQERLASTSRWAESGSSLRVRDRDLKLREAVICCVCKAVVGITKSDIPSQFLEAILNSNGA